MIAAPLAALVAEPQDRELPATGSNPDDMLALAFALVAAGTVLLWSRRSNRTS
jgi:LPXTG-motif cell wall-anchored protein